VKKIRAVVYGVGETGSVVTRLLVEKDVEIVGAIARSNSKVGRDLGEVIGLGRTLDVPVRRDAEVLLNEVQADIAVISTTNYLSEHEPHLAVCARTGTNAITASPESLYPWRTSPEAAQRLDELAKGNGVTLTGGGMQDVYWITLMTTLLGAAHKVDAVKGLCSFDLDVIGPVAAREVQIGERPELLRPTGSDGVPNPSLNGLHCLVAALGLTIAETTSEVRPLIADHPVHSKSLDGTIEVGHVAGRSEFDRITTDEGITLEMTLTGRIFGPEDRERNEWSVEGEPNLTLTNPEMPSAVGTGAQLVNRIPDVINAEPGFVTVDRLPSPRYRVRPLETYVMPSTGPAARGGRRPDDD
jgi:2,4-diaminopentanoate dehydrogenase